MHRTELSMTMTMTATNQVRRPLLYLHTLNASNTPPTEPPHQRVTTGAANDFCLRASQRHVPLLGGTPNQVDLIVLHRGTNATTPQHQLSLLRNFKSIGKVNLNWEAFFPPQSNNILLESIEMMSLTSPGGGNSDTQNSTTFPRSVLLSTIWSDGSHKCIVLYFPQKQHKGKQTALPQYTATHCIPWKCVQHSHAQSLRCFALHNSPNTVLYRLLPHSSPQTSQHYSMEMITLESCHTADKVLPQSPDKHSSHHLVHNFSLNGHVLDFQPLILGAPHHSERFLAILLKHHHGYTQLLTFKQDNMQPGPFHLDNLSQMTNLRAFSPNSNLLLPCCPYPGVVVASERKLTMVMGTTSSESLDFDQPIAHVHRIRALLSLDSQKRLQRVFTFLVLTSSNLHLVQLECSAVQQKNVREKGGISFKMCCSLDLDDGVEQGREGLLRGREGLSRGSENLSHSTSLHMCNLTVSNSAATVYIQTATTDCLCRVDLDNMRFPSQSPLIWNPNAQFFGGVHDLAQTATASHENLFMACCGDAVHTVLRQCMYGYHLEWLCDDDEDGTGSLLDWNHLESSGAKDASSSREERRFTSTGNKSKTHNSSHSSSEKPPTLIPKLFSVSYPPHSLVFLSYPTQTRVFFTKTMAPLNLPSIRSKSHSLLVAASSQQEYFIQVTPDEVLLASFTRAHQYASWSPPSSLDQQEQKISLASTAHDRLAVACSCTLHLFNVSNKKIQQEMEPKRFQHQISSVCICRHGHADKSPQQFLVAVAFWVGRSVVLIDMQTMEQVACITLPKEVGIVRSIGMVWRNADCVHCVLGYSTGTCSMHVLERDGTKSLPMQFKLCTQQQLLRRHNAKPLHLKPFSCTQEGECLQFVGNDFLIEYCDALDEMRVRYLHHDLPTCREILELCPVQVNQYGGGVFVTLVRDQHQQEQAPHQNIAHSTHRIAFCQLSTQPDIHWHTLDTQFGNSSHHPIQTLTLKSIHSHRQPHAEMLLNLVLTPSSLVLCNSTTSTPHTVHDQFSLENTREHMKYITSLDLVWTPTDQDPLESHETRQTLIVVQSELQPKSPSSTPLCILRLFSLECSLKPALVFEDYMIMGEGNSTIPTISCAQYLLVHLGESLNLCRVAVDEKLGFKFSVQVVCELFFRIPPGMQLGRLEIMDSFSAAAMHIEGRFDEGHHHQELHRPASTSKEDAKLSTPSQHTIMIAASTIRHGLITWMYDTRRKELLQIACDALDRSEDAPHAVQNGFCSAMKFVSKHSLLIATFDGYVKLISLNPQLQEKKAFDLKFVDEDAIRDVLDKHIVRVEVGQKPPQAQQQLQGRHEHGKPFEMQMPLFSFVTVAQVSVNGIIVGFVPYNLDASPDLDSIPYLWATRSGGIGIVKLVGQEQQHTLLKHFICSKRTLDGNQMVHFVQHASKKEKKALCSKFGITSISVLEEMLRGVISGG